MRSFFVVVTAAAIVLLTASSAPAQSNAPSSAADRTEILFLGTAGGPPLRLDRSEPSAVLNVDGRPYLIDCGIGTMRRMLEAGVASESIKTIFFTHLHADHDLGLADVMGNDFFRLNLAGSAQTINIYGPPQTKDLVDAAFHYITFGFTAFAAEPGAIRAGLVNGQFKSPFVAREIERDGLFYRDDKIRVTAAENTHYILMPAQLREKMKSYSYRIETPHGVVAFTGDTGPSDAVTDLAKGADVLVTEVQDANRVNAFVKQMAEQNHWSAQRAAALLAHMNAEHLSQEQVGDMATKAQVHSVVLYHYDPENAAAYLAAIKKHFAGPVFASADLDRYCIGSADGNSKNAPILRRCHQNALPSSRSSAVVTPQKPAPPLSSVVAHDRQGVRH
ncbi:MAG: MBL fold metallo-hydrolase [Candidatus Acidiferrales bacterium]